ncbi:PEP-CTERM sorting domain-containing protein [Psychrosphaera sp. B3R10]|uniref:PEP-CTERM sorting domain-containing protein n=1 Tax=unclassified Psychrosphaera TaxID=2641570 RepID=UPI001C0A2E5F|nr:MULTISPECIES: PEP-CTERM sorting domain-containing protein [unclassified Psychrosphaera]MBU2881884.1 PEP-CTERM sorting domain-containing protein [Psychrosphaera sp. I2R16]MBU2987875.1 PEP-CTERM sorting domain-containing protein [Psychrosphaera sp. B3R10]MDO6721491.1 PEP-CTERM sorting domain-containing protein [Psychrosphaera sp. 1_MG-2023]
MLKRTLFTFVLALIISSQVNATIIVDAEFEQGQNGLVSNGGWYSTSSQAPYFGGTANPEGDWVAHATTGSQDIYTNDISNGDYTIQEGAYTIYFNAGNWSNESFLNFDITFAGMNENLATTSTKNMPGSGQWELWSFTWEVDANSAFIGNVLSFTANSIGTAANSNGAIDGVGSYSALGNGFLVDYTANVVPEPSTLVVFALTILGLGARRSFNKNI